MRVFKTGHSRPLRRWPTPEELRRFLAKVREGAIPDGQDTPCWVWTAYTNDKGYGQFRFAGKVEWAHRFSLQAFKHVKLPKGEEAHHVCLNASCVNPEHLDPRTKLENVVEANQRRWEAAYSPPDDDVPF